jgi:hypothetical protein
MKSLLLKTGGSIIFMFLFFQLWAQDGKKVDVDINVNKGSNWYQQPWVWIVGGALFILLLVALVRGGSRRDD